MSHPPGIHPTAIIDPKAQLGDQVRIGPYSVIGPDVVIGDGCDIGSHVVIDGRTTLGSGNRIFPHNAIGLAPQDLKFKDEPSRLEIGDNNTFREFMTVHIGTEGGGMLTRIGSDNLFMAYVHIAHDCIIGSGCILANAVTLAGHVTVGDRAVIGGITPVHQFNRIGEGAMVGGGSVVTEDISPYCLAVGNRAVLRGLNLVGLKRQGLNREQIRILKQAYAMIFDGDQPVREAAEKAKSTWPDDPRIEILTQFITGSDRGVCS
ncbi:MAG: acyl-ACP--UDP-N-acetylglucosamine O-acyltransferase [Leptospirillia bacterium]